MLKLQILLIYPTFIFRLKLHFFLVGASIASQYVPYLPSRKNSGINATVFFNVHRIYFSTISSILTKSLSSRDI